MTALSLITSGSERALLEAMLDRNRAELIETVAGLSEEQARLRLVTSATTPIGLIKHAAAGERIWFQHYLGGLSEQECDGYAQRGAGSFAVSENETLADVIAEFERASATSRAIAGRYDLEHTVQHPRAGTVSLRFVYLLGIEDFARHAGHGDILREQIVNPVDA